MDIKEGLVKAFNRVEILACQMCGAFLDRKEYDAGDGVCFKHWDV